MHPKTIATLDELEKATWFSHVGGKDTSVAIVLSSWQEAIKYCSSIEWRILCIEASNQYRERLVEHSKERFGRWNEIAAELKRTTVPLVSQKIEAIVHQHGLPKTFGDMVQWNILGASIEAEYADVNPSGFNASHAFWYIRGHFPCGWQGGDFP